MNLEEIIEREINFEGISKEVKVDSRTLLMLKLSAVVNIESKSGIEDPFHSEGARLFTYYMPELLCGPKITNAELVNDEIKICNYENVKLDKCIYNCAPIMVLAQDDQVVRVFPPCHGIESPSCCQLASYCGTGPCVKLKARGCKYRDSYITVYTLLDMTQDEYEFNYVGIFGDDKPLLGAWTYLFPGFVKYRDTIVYIYFEIRPAVSSQHPVIGGKQTPGGSGSMWLD